MLQFGNNLQSSNSPKKKAQPQKSNEDPKPEKENQPDLNSAPTTPNNRKRGKFCVALQELPVIEKLFNCDRSTEVGPHSRAG